MRPLLLAVVATTLLATGCATTTTRLAPISPEDVRAEQANQQRLVLLELNKAQRRLDDLALPLLAAATPLCPHKTAPVFGFSFQTLADFEGSWRDAARDALALSDTLVVTGVTADSSADGAGLTPGDRIIAINGESLPIGRGSAEAASRILERNGRSEAVLEVSRDGRPLRLPITPQETCGFRAQVTIEGDINAFADGQNVIVPWAMMRFANDDELKVVLSHEIAHNAMRHIEARIRNAMWGALFGALTDVALAMQGVNTGGENTNAFMAAAAAAFSQDFEREADHIGMYILALAGVPLESAPEFWRQFAQINPSAISYAGTHPTTAERFVRLRQTMAEIEAKQRMGAALLPEMKE